MTKQEFGLSHSPHRFGRERRFLGSALPRRLLLLHHLLDTPPGSGALVFQSLLHTLQIVAYLADYPQGYTRKE